MFLELLSKYAAIIMLTAMFVNALTVPFLSTCGRVINFAFDAGIDFEKAIVKLQRVKGGWIASVTDMHDAWLVWFVIDVLMIGIIGTILVELTAPCLGFWLLLPLLPVMIRLIIEFFKLLDRIFGF
ncbi:TMhelix containing protein [Vibrio phage 1.081.O._10N.286.52.C2]|nr:TMhelix containing protein [Vibrio phage 1.081.O._10N.286.52.C2]